MSEINWYALETKVRERFNEDWLGYNEDDVKESMDFLESVVTQVIPAGDAVPIDLAKKITEELEASKHGEALARLDLWLEDSSNYMTDDPIGYLNTFHHEGGDV